MKNEKIYRAAHFLKSGKVVAFPTDTVYALGASLSSKQGIRKIFDIKKRSLRKPLAVLISHLDQLREMASNLPKSFFAFSRVFFPGPLTLIVKKHPQIPSLITGGLDTIGVRMPDHKVTRELIDALGGPLVATSANRSGGACFLTAGEIKKEFNDEIAYLLDGGKTPDGIESTVIDLVSFDHPKILREAKITKEELIHHDECYCH